jgi:hypothetical protein
MEEYRVVAAVAKDAQGVLNGLQDGTGRQPILGEGHRAITPIGANLTPDVPRTSYEAGALSYRAHYAEYPRSVVLPEPLIPSNKDIEPPLV